MEIKGYFEVWKKGNVEMLVYSSEHNGKTSVIWTLEHYGLPMDEAEAIEWLHDADWASAYWETEKHTYLKREGFEPISEKFYIDWKGSN